MINVLAMLAIIVQHTDRAATAASHASQAQSTVAFTMVISLKAADACHARLIQHILLKDTL
jgi:hypothetical protein